MKRPNSINHFMKGLRRSKRVLLTCHRNPEGDAIGSILAIESLLRRLGKKTLVVCEDVFPKRLKFMYSPRWKSYAQITSSTQAYDAMVMADCAVLDRIGIVKQLIHPQMTLFNIDHHISNTCFADYNYIGPKAASTGELVMDLFRGFKIKPNKLEAMNIYVAIATDTDSFRHPNTSSKSHQIACELIEAGIDLENINEALYSNYSINKLKLYSRLFDRMKTSHQGRLAWICVKHKDLKKYQVSEEDTEGFVDVLRRLRDVKIAFFILEYPKKRGVRLSLRSKNPYNVNDFAAVLGGGGHAQSAGCLLPMKLEEAESLILKEMRRWIR